LWRRRIDPLALGFGASLIYFIPGLVGATSFAVDRATTYTASIAPGATGIMAMVLASTICASVLVDRLSPVARIRVSFGNLLPPVFLAIVSAGAAISITSVGAYYFCTDKAVMLGRIDGWYYLAAYALPLSLVSAVAARQLWVAAAAAVFVAADLYIGFRASAAISLLGVALVLAPMAFRSRRGVAGYVGALAFGGAMLFMFPQFTWSLKYMANEACPVAVSTTASPTPIEITTDSPTKQLKHLAEELQTARPYYQAFLQSEPFVIQTVLSEVVRQDFRTDGSYLVDQILTGVPAGVTLFGLSPTAPTSFNELFQPVLFPNIGFGMANSPWAQSYAAGGYELTAVFAISYGLMLALLTLWFNGVAGAIKGIPAVIAAWFGFYSHRNDLAGEIGILKQVVYTSALAVLVAGALWYAVKIAHRGQALA
jgi:hypothetical protein